MVDPDGCYLEAGSLARTVPEAEPYLGERDRLGWDGRTERLVRSRAVIRFSGSLAHERPSVTECDQTSRGWQGHLAPPGTLSQRG